MIFHRSSAELSFSNITGFSVREGVEEPHLGGSGSGCRGEEFWSLQAVLRRPSFSSVESLRHREEKGEIGVKTRNRGDCN